MRSPVLNDSTCSDDSTWSNSPSMPALRIDTSIIARLPLVRMPIGRPAAFSARSAARFSGNADRLAYWFISRVSPAASSGSPSRAAEWRSASRVTSQNGL